MATAAKSAEQSAAGTSLTFVVKSGGNDFHGQLAAEWSDSSFQSKNIDQDLLDRGFSPSPNAFTKYTDYYGEIGGPLVKDKFWFYFTDRHGYGGRLIPGFIDNRDGQDAQTGPPAEFYTILRDPTIKLTWQLTDNNKLETMVQFGRKWQPYRGGSRTRPLLSTQNQDSWSAVGPMLKWTYIASPTTTLDVQVSRGGYWWPSIPWTSGRVDPGPELGRDPGWISRDEPPPGAVAVELQLQQVRRSGQYVARAEDRLPRLVGLFERHRPGRVPEPAVLPIPVDGR